MPAGSDRVPDTDLPVTFRPLGVRMAVVLFGLLLVGVCAVVWLAFPAEVRARFDVLQRITLLLIGLGFAAIGYAMARCRVEARPEGLLVVNGFRVREYAWGDVAGVRLRPGAPWAVVELADGSTAAAMGIQGSDGPRATAQLQRLRSILAEHPGGDGSRR
jgi:Bacterial PH domain